jgi:hypothetical protein
MITEKFDIPDNINVLCDAAGDYIVGHVLYNYLKNRVKNIKTQSDDGIVATNIIYKKSKTLIQKGKQHFKNVHVQQFFTQHGLYREKFVPKSDSFPPIFLQVTNFNDGSTINGAYVPKVNIILITVNIQALLKSFVATHSEINGTIKHEARHFLQMTHHNKSFGLPKDNLRGFGGVAKNDPILKKYSVDKLGQVYKDNAPTSKILAHQFRPVEFKTNIYTYSEEIIRYLSANFKKPDWKKGFREFISNIATFYLESASRKITTDTKRVRAALQSVKKEDPARWKQYIKEIYDLIF